MDPVTPPRRNTGVSSGLQARRAAETTIPVTAAMGTEGTGDRRPGQRQAPARGSAASPCASTCSGRLDVRKLRRSSPAGQCRSATRRRPRRCERGVPKHARRGRTARAKDCKLPACATSVPERPRERAEADPANEPQRRAHAQALGREDSSQRRHTHCGGAQRRPTDWPSDRICAAGSAPGCAAHSCGKWPAGGPRTRRSIDWAERVCPPSIAPAVDGYP